MLNKVQLIGFLGADPECRATTDGTTVTTIRLATSESYKDKQGVKQEQTEWHHVVLYGKLGDIAAEYLKKGTLVFIEGKIKTRKWQDKEGNDRYSTDIIASEMKMMPSGGGRKEDSPPSAAPTKKPEKKSPTNYVDDPFDGPF